MRGVTFLGERKLELAEFPDPAPGPADVVIEIKASGMCGSDLKFYRASDGTSSLGLGKVRKIDVEHRFTNRWQLAQADEAYRLFDRQTSGKGDFVMS
jgi:hypothetical protein